MVDPGVAGPRGEASGTSAGLRVDGYGEVMTLLMARCETVMDRITYRDEERKSFRSLQLETRLI